MHAFIEDKLHEQDLKNALKPFEMLTPEQRQRIYRDYAYESSGRQTHIIRELPVRYLTVTECGRLLVHSHSPGEMRRKAYLLVKVGEHPEIYFKPEEQARIREWMNTETLDNITH